MRKPKLIPCIFVLDTENPNIKETEKIFYIEKPQVEYLNEKYSDDEDEEIDENEETEFEKEREEVILEYAENLFGVRLSWWNTQVEWYMHPKKYGFKVKLIDMASWGKKKKSKNNLVVSK